MYRHSLFLKHFLNTIVYRFLAKKLDLRQPESVNLTSRNFEITMAVQTPRPDNIHVNKCELKRFKKAKDLNRKTNWMQKSFITFSKLVICRKISGSLKNQVSNQR